MSTDYTQQYLFRITHRDNIPYLLSSGIYAANHPLCDPNYVGIGNSDIITRRESKLVPFEGYGELHDYVPFYFNIKSIMLYNIVTGYGGVTKRDPREIVVLCVRIATILQQKLKYFFTDGHALMAHTSFFTHPGDLRQIAWQWINTNDFSSDPQNRDKKRQYQAEFHVYQQVPIGCLDRILAYDTDTAKFVKQHLQMNNHSVPAKCAPNHYF